MSHKTVILNNPQIPLSKLLKEFCYGLASFLIALLFAQIQDWDLMYYAWAIPVIDGLLHGFVMALKPYESKRAKDFIPAYQWLVDIFKRGIEALKTRKLNTP